MKNFLFLVLVLLFSFSCSKDSVRYSNPYLPNNPVSIFIDLNLPAYDKLKFPNNSVIIENQGVMGVIVFNAGPYKVAYDIACPNHPVDRNCSRMKLDKPGDIFLTCSCEQHPTPLQFSLLTGTSQTPGAQYQLKPYTVTEKGNTLSINY